MKRALLYLLQGAALSVGLFLVFAGWRQQVALEQPLRLAEERLLEVGAGSTPNGLLNGLEGEGVLDGALWLRLYWRFNLDGQPLHAGEYRLTPGQTARELLGQWQRGEVVQYSLTLVEGWNFRQLRAALRAQERLEQTLAEVDDATLMERLGGPASTPRGASSLTPTTMYAACATSTCCARPTSASGRCSTRSGRGVPRACPTVTPTRRW